MNVLDAAVVALNNKICLKLGDGNIINLMPEMQKLLKQRGYINKKVYLGIRPENLHDFEVDSLTGDFSTIKGIVEVAELMGAEIYLYLSINGQQISARVDSHSRMRAGDTIELQFHMNKIYLFDTKSEKAIR